MNDPSPDKLDDLMDRFVFDLLDAKATERVRSRIETDPRWQVAYEAAVKRKRALTAEVRGQADRFEQPAPAVADVVAAAEANPAGPPQKRLLTPFSPERKHPMRRIAPRFWAVAAALILLNLGGILWIRHSLLGRDEGGPPAKLRVLQALPTGYADQADRLSLVFEQEIAPTGAVGQPLTEALFEIDPAPPGRWVWADQRRLDYVLSQPLPPGRRYTVRAADGIETRTGRALVGESEFHFETRRLALTSCKLYTADRTHVDFELTFNQVVDPADVARYTHVYEGPSAAHDPRFGPRGPRGRSPLKVTAQTPKPSESVVLRTRRPESGALRIVLDAKLTGPGAVLGLGQEVVERLEASPVFALVGVNVPTPQFTRRIAVELNFSADLARKQDLPKVVVRPAVKGLKVSRSGRSLHLTGEFISGRRYTATVPATVLSHDAQTLAEAKSLSFEIPNREPGVRLPARRGILMPGGNLCLDVEAVNISGLNVSAWRVYPNQLLAHLQRGWAGFTSRPLPDKTIRLDLPRNTPKKMTLDLARLLKDPRGVYGIEVAATHPSWLDSTATVTITDLALTAKRQADLTIVWVTSLKTGKPVAGAEVTAMSHTNQNLARATTDADGIARLAVSASHPDGDVYVVIARLGEDFSYLVPEDHQWVIDDVDQSGAPTPGAYDVMLYTERGVYRPGDTIHLTGVVRDQIGQVPRPFPLTVTVIRPDGREVADLPAVPAKDGQGVFHVEFDTHEHDRTGLYRFECSLPGSGEELGSTRAYVEAFVPLRMEVKAEPTAERYGPKDKPEIAVTARYLWDQPAAELPVSVACTYRKIAFKSKKHAGYTFGDSVRARKSPDDVQAKLDKQGCAKVALPPPAGPGEDPGKRRPQALWQATVSATVTETGGRSVSANASVVVDRLDRHIGLRLTPRQVVRVASPLRVDWVRLTGEDKPAPPGEMQVRLIRIEHDWILQEVDRRTVWKSVERIIPEADSKIPAGGSAGMLQITCRKPGTHRLEVTDLETGSTTRADFYASHAAAGPETLPMNRPERLEVLLDKAEYLPGSKARVVVRSPLSGTALVTLETDQVLAHRVVPVAKNSAEVVFDLPATLRGGAFVTATVVRPIDPSRDKWLPHRAMGMARLETTHEARRLDVRIQAAKKARPGETISVTLDVGSCQDPARPGWVHLWAVDEGILLTTGYDTPDPHAHFFAARGLGVATSDLFGRLLPDHRRAKGIDRIGAGGHEEPEMGSLRRSPVPTKLRRPAVVWQAAMPVQADGRVTARVPLPELIGEMRLMVVAVDHDRYGAAEHAVTLTTPMVLEASWPRFAAPGDEFDVPVKLFNSTGKPVAVALKITATGPIRIEPGAGAERILIKPREPEVHWLRATATGMGPVEVRVEAREVSQSPAPLTAVAKAAFPVRPATALHATADVRRIEAGKGLVLPAPGEFVPGTCTRVIHVSGKPTVELTPAIEQLLRYPYGCLEQTTSGLYPLLYAPDLIGQQLPEDARTGHVIDMVNAGISRLWAMQTPSGGLAYWPRQHEPSLWGTAYAAGFLLEAKTAGYKVDPRFLKELVKYLEGQLGQSTEINDNTRALICRVLATFGRVRRGWMARLAERPERLDIAGRAHLAGAYVAIGRKDLARRILSKDTLALGVTGSTGGRITSKTRQLAVLLGVLLDLDSEHAWIPAAVRSLEAARKNGRWGNTLENASVLAALSRYQVLSDEKPSFRGTVQPPGGPPAPFDHTKPLTLTVRGDGPVQISTAGKGSVYVTHQAKGLAREDLLEPYDRNLIVRRIWTDRRGRPIDPAKLRVGDLVHVHVALQVPKGSALTSAQNVAVVDALPGGMEVENPRLVSSAAVASTPPEVVVPAVAPEEHIAEAVLELSPLPAEVLAPLAPLLPGEPPTGEIVNNADRVEFLDDRVILFSTASHDRRVFHYALRVTTAGEFTVPPIQASCMYDDTIASLGKAGRVTIRK